MGTLLKLEKIVTGAEFSDFWAIYPRKIAKQSALKMWRRLTDDEMTAALAAIPRHVSYWQATGREVEKIPHAGTWLNPVDGRRWEDELPAPAKRNGNGSGAPWWASNEGIQAKAAELHVEPRKGESWADLKSRVSTAMGA